MGPMGPGPGPKLAAGTRDRARDRRQFWARAHGPMGPWGPWPIYLNKQLDIRFHILKIKSFCTKWVQNKDLGALIPRNCVKFRPVSF